MCRGLLLAQVHGEGGRVQPGSGAVGDRHRSRARARPPVSPRRRGGRACTPCTSPCMLLRCSVLVSKHLLVHRCAHLLVTDCPKPPAWRMQVPAQLVRVIDDCLQQNPAHRPTARQVFQYAFSVACEFCLRGPFSLQCIAAQVVIMQLTHDAQATAGVPTPRSTGRRQCQGRFHPVRSCRSALMMHVYVFMMPGCYAPNVAH